MKIFISIAGVCLIWTHMRHLFRQLVTQSELFFFIKLVQRRLNYEMRDQIQCYPTFLLTFLQFLCFVNMLWNLKTWPLYMAMAVSGISLTLSQFSSDASCKVGTIHMGRPSTAGQGLECGPSEHRWHGPNPSSPSHLTVKSYWTSIFLLTM